MSRIMNPPGLIVASCLSGGPRAFSASVVDGALTTTFAYWLGKASGLGGSVRCERTLILLTTAVGTPGASSGGSAVTVTSSGTPTKNVLRPSRPASGTPAWVLTCTTALNGPLAN